MSEWQPIETAPVVEFADDSPQTCLVYGPEIGVQMGRAWRYSNGEARGRASGFYGDFAITHWMDLPEPPK